MTTVDEVCAVRRSFLHTMIAGGFALAVQPVCAQTVISTHGAGLQTGMVEIDAGDVKLPAYYAKPANQTSAPIILVVQEIFGVHAWLQDICRRLAKLGYLAVAPALYFRQGDPTQETSNEDIQKNIVSKVPDAQVMADLDATAKWAGQQGGNIQRLGITGFCWGGRITWLYAAHNPQLKAGVAWYGKVIGNSTPLTPQHPVQIAAQVKAPVLGLYGGQDKNIPLDSLEQMRTALAATPNKQSEIIVYPSAQHGFLADYRPSYNPEAAAKAWQKMQEWFKAHGV